MSGMITKLVDMYINYNEPRTISTIATEMGFDSKGMRHREGKIRATLNANTDLFYNPGDGAWHATDKALKFHDKVEAEPEVDEVLFELFDLDIRDMPDV